MKRLAMVIIPSLPPSAANAQIKWGAQTGLQHSTLYSAYRGNDFQKYARLNPWESSIAMPGFYVDVPLGKRPSYGPVLTWVSFFVT